METLLSSSSCQEGFVPSEGCLAVGINLETEPEVDKDTIRFSEDCWNDEKLHFMEKINEAIERHEKRYGTDIVHIALVGKIGLWNGSPIGGVVFGISENPLEKMGNVDEVEVVRSENGTITILGHHHDGTHRMHVYLLSEKMLDKINPYWNSSYFDWSPEDMIRIYETKQPLKIKAY